MIAKEKTITSISIVTTETKNADVMWQVKIVEDGKELSSYNEAKSYSKEQKADFLKEVEGADKYISALGW